MRMLVLGAGLQGSACAYDLLNCPEVGEVRLADLRPDSLPAFLAAYSAPRLVVLPLDVRDDRAVLAALDGCDAVMSATPYYFNARLAALAVHAGVHYSDLGGNTDVVLQQKRLDEHARERGVSVIPDCGLAPGMVNVLARHGIDQLDAVDAVRIYVGGLPQHPEPPLNYHIVYSLEGVLDYYTTRSWVLRDGHLVQVDALSEVEPVTFPAPIGELEAFHTSGGLSTMAFTYEGRIRTMEYKTLRYPGHAEVMRTIRDLGFLDAGPITVKGTDVSPRDVAVAVMDPRLRKPDAPDLVALRVTVSGCAQGARRTLAWELVDWFDRQHSLSAMMRTTGYSLAITGLMQVRAQAGGPGVHTPDEAVPAQLYIDELSRRGIRIRSVA